jgi:hypothetical protein
MKNSWERYEDPDLESLIEGYRKYINYLSMKYLEHYQVSPEFTIKLPSVVNLKRSINSFNDTDIPILFRFRDKSQLHRLIAGFNFPDSSSIGGYRFSGEELLLCGLYRLHSPNTLGDLNWQNLFGWTQSKRSYGFKEFLNVMKKKFYLVTNNFSFWVKYFPQYAEAIRKKLLSLGSFHVVAFESDGGFCVAAFIDNKLVGTCRPGGGPRKDGHRNDPLIQQAFYNGWKSIHGIKFQTIDLPCGMNLHVWGPCSVRHNDVETWNYSNINNLLRDCQVNEVFNYIISNYFILFLIKKLLYILYIILGITV